MARSKPMMQNESNEEYSLDSLFTYWKTKVFKKKDWGMRKEACLKSGKLLGISTFDFLMFPDMKLDDIPQLEINLQIEKLIKKYKPTTVYTTPYSDFHKDHQKIDIHLQPSF